MDFPSPGWYEDPENSTQWCFWDGVDWSTYTSPVLGEGAELKDISFEVTDEGKPLELSIVGESFYQTQLSAVFKKHNEGGRVFVDGRLVSNPENKFDVNAVELVIEGILVGHLSRAKGKKYSEMFKPSRACTVVVGMPGNLSAGYYWAKVLKVSMPEI